MSNHERHMRTTPGGTTVWLSPFTGCYMVYAHHPDGTTTEKGEAVFHDSGKWAFHPRSEPDLWSSDFLKAIAGLLDQLNLETEQEKVA